MGEEGTYTEGGQVFLSAAKLPFIYPQWLW